MIEGVALVTAEVVVFSDNGVKLSTLSLFPFRGCLGIVGMDIETGYEAEVLKATQ